MENKTRGSVNIEVELYDELKKKIYDLEKEKEEYEDKLYIQDIQIRFYQTYSGILMINNTNQDKESLLNKLFKTVEEGKYFKIELRETIDGIKFNDIVNISKPIRFKQT